MHSDTISRQYYRHFWSILHYKYQQKYFYSFNSIKILCIFKWVIINNNNLILYCNPICSAQSAECLVLKYVPYFQRLFFLSLLLMKGTFFTLWCNFCEQQNRRHTHCRQCTVVDREPYKTLLKTLEHYTPAKILWT